MANKMNAPYIAALSKQAEDNSEPYMYYRVQLTATYVDALV